jgi:hypothetical protein
MWLVLINNAGHWVGKLIGGDGNMAGSDGVEFDVDADGNVSASNGGNETANSGNGAGSDNNANSNQTSNSTTEQNNNANVENTLNLSANTGKNHANENTGGSSTVKTGDAKIIANVVNFVNNNIKGSGKLVVTVVNVFGSWVGNFITPGHTKEEGNQVANAQGATNTTSNTNATPAPSATTTPSTSTQNVSSTTTKVKTAWNYLTTSGNGSNGGNAGVDAQITDPENNVLGTTQTLGQTQTKNAFTINLAYLILLLPLGLAIYALKKRSSIAKVFNELSKNTRHWFF